MQISLREFELFTATVELGTLTAAAETLGMSQPAASKLLRNLEERLGLTLFHRHNRQLLPTPEALELYPGLSHALSSFDAVKRTAFNLRDGQDGQINIVTNPAVAANILPTAIEAFRRSYGRISLVVRTHSTLEIMDMIRRGRADIGVIYEAGADETLAIETFSEVPIGCLLHPASPLAQYEAIALPDLNDQVVIALGKTQPVGAALRRLMHETGASIRIGIEVSQSATACAFVEKGLGVAVLDALGLSGGRQRGLVSRPLLPRTSVRLSLVQSRSGLRIRVLGYLRDCIHQATTQAISSPGGIGLVGE